MSRRLLSAAAAMPAPPRPLVFCGPSGVGKSTLLKRLMADHPHTFGFSVSHTTRGPRPGETDGVDYHFTDRAAFEAQVKEGAFLETAEFSGNCYGTSYRALLDVLEAGRWCILDIEIKGVQQVKESPLLKGERLPAFVFIQPPSLDHLRQRLTARNTDSADAIERRLQRAAVELEYGAKEGMFDHVVVNDDLDTAYASLRAFIEPLLKA